MIQTIYILHCDNCKEAFDEKEDKHFDGAIFSRGEVRKIARSEGWKRIEEKDYCAACTASLTKRKKVG
jgi:hypothetical protein